MISRRLTLLAVALLAGICTFVGPTGPAVADADEVHLPIVGRQFFVAGLEARGGPVLDYRQAPMSATATVGPRARIGLHHVIGDRLSMNLEGSFGATYLQAHPMAPAGEGDSQVSFDFTLSGLARYMAIGPLRGWTFAGGLHYRRAGLQTGSLLQMGIDGRVGYTVWTSDERFLIVEIGLHAPLLEGISLPQQAIPDEDDEEAQVPDHWYQPSASIGIQWAF